ncbi:MAG: hypothetical protein H7330_11810, partial [Hymenobacteraceae bacterium]|nr:hypothetical protein [Hymenobacteraceae bacterium]
MSNRLLTLILSLAVAGLSSSLPAFAQPGYHVNNMLRLGQNPGGLNQDVELPGGGGGWTEVYRYPSTWVVATTRGLPLPPGFNFRLNGQFVTAVRASTEQWLALDTVSATATSFWPPISLPDARFAGPFVWLGDECRPNSSAYSFGGARIYTKTFGTAPHRQFWVQWNNLPKNKDAILRMQPAYASIVLEETTNRIFIVYQRMSWGWRARTRAGVQLSPTTAIVADSMEIANPWQNDATPADNLAHVFEPGPGPAPHAGGGGGHA